MIVTCVTVYVKHDQIDNFINATLENHRKSIEEIGNMRFDVLQCNDDNSRFLLYEAYSTEDAAALHKKTDHYLKWRETVADWMAKPREGVSHKVLAPLDKNQWE